MTSPVRRAVVGALALTALSAPLALLGTDTADASVVHASSYHYTNCAALHKDFKHGVGKAHAKDHHSKSSKAVTDFKKSTRIYNAVVDYRSGLDRDKDGIACEAH